jgi:hypothetical protein
MVDRKVEDGDGEEIRNNAPLSNFHQLENIDFENFTMNNEYLIINSYSIIGFHWTSTTLFI